MAGTRIADAIRVQTNTPGGDPKVPVKQDSPLPDPRAVLKDPGLTREQKIEKLRRWSYDAREVDVANEEGMGGKVRPSNLAAVQEALRELGATEEGTTSTE